MTLARIRPKLSIRGKLITAFVGLSVIPVLLVGIYGIVSNMRTLRQFALEGLTHDVQTVCARAGNFLSGVQSDLLVLRNSSLMNQLVARLERNGSGISMEATGRLASELLAFSKTRRIYYQISIIDEERNEQLRVECTDIADGGSTYRIVPASELREGGGALYFYLASRVSPNQIVFSPAELLYGTAGQIPVVNIIMPLFSSGRRVGLLVASVFAGNLLEVMRAGRSLEEDAKVILVGTDGYFFYHSDLKNDWNRLIAERTQGNLRNLYPPSVCNAILAGGEGIITKGSDDIIVYAPLFPTKSAGQVPEDRLEFAETLTLVEAVPTGTIIAPARSFAWAFSGFLVLFIGSAVVLGLIATRQFTKPIGEVSRGAETIARGNYRYRLSVRTGDEIETLSEQFNRMAQALEEHEEEIGLHRARLEEMVRHRTNELVEEKAKLQAILDNVPSAFLLLDNNFGIQAASASFRTITGIRTDGVRGTDCRTIFTSAGLCTRDLQEAVAGGRIESHIDHRIETTGVERLVEHITIPLVEEGKPASIVMIMTDVTQRKRLEQQLIQSEKLMATGEMAAIIAHEFRNALTSVKMILQLQQESRRRTDDERTSLNVALASIHHMETIVQELLNFARPSPLEFHEADIRAIIEESLSFVRLGLQKQRITIATEIADAFPPVFIDAARLKEALVNILLNAIQAIGGKEHRPGEEQIKVSARRIVLSRSIRDFVGPDPADGESGGRAEQREMVLRKGTECILIAVSDSGPGIDPDLLPRIFDPFFTTKPEGTGLGLPMVKRTVNAHGGIVAVRSTRGKGSTFEIILPRAEIDRRGEARSVVTGKVMA